MGIHIVHVFRFCYQDSRLFSNVGDLSCCLHLGHQLNMYVFISTSFVPIANTVSSCTGFKALQVFFNFCRLSQQLRWTVIGNFSHADSFTGYSCQCFSMYIDCMCV